MLIDRAVDDFPDRFHELPAGGLDRPPDYNRDTVVSADAATYPSAVRTLARLLR